jgi:hypothetical protein
MFKWWKRRRDLKKLKSLKEILLKSLDALEIIEQKTIIGDKTSTSMSSVSSKDITEIDVFKIKLGIQVILNEMDVEIDDRTRVREPLFKEELKDKKKRN